MLSSARGTDREITKKYIYNKIKFGIPSVGLKAKSGNYFITMELNRTLAHKNQRNKNYDVGDKVIKSIKINAKNEKQAIQKTEAVVFENSSFVGAVYSVEHIATSIKNIEFIDIIN